MKVDRNQERVETKRVRAEIQYRKKQQESRSERRYDTRENPDDDVQRMVDDGR